VAAGGG